MPPERKRHGILIAQCLALCTYAQKHPQLTQIQLQQWFKSEFQHLLTQPTISESLSAKYTHLDAQSSDKSTLPTTCQRQKPAKYPELEDALFEWHQQLQKDVPLSGEGIQAQARRFWYQLAPYQGMEVPQFSSGWLHKFKSRYNIRQRVYHGEAFTALQSLRLFEEQQEDGKALFLRIFDDYEACLINRRCLRRRQQRITSYLA